MGGSVLWWYIFLCLAFRNVHVNNLYICAYVNMYLRWTPDVIYFIFIIFNCYVMACCWALSQVGCEAIIIVLKYSSGHLIFFLALPFHLSHLLLILLILYKLKYFPSWVVSAEFLSLTCYNLNLEKLVQFRKITSQR